MSYNMMDTKLYEKIDCKAEQHYHRKFASYQKYTILVGSLDQSFELDLSLIIEENEANDPKYAEIVMTKNCNIKFNSLYGSDPFNKLVKAIDAALNPYYIVEANECEIYLTAKVKGHVPSMQTPAIEIKTGASIAIVDEEKGRDTGIFVLKPNEIHLPKTTFGDNYKPPNTNDIIYLIDSVKGNRDRTFIRTITNVVESGYCTCDILTLDLPIDRLNNDGRINGIGLQSPAAISNNYTASFNKTQIWKRKDNFDELLKDQANPTGECLIPINNFMNMKPIVKEIMSRLDSNEFEYFGTFFHWKQFEDLLKPFHDKFGEYLCDELNVLKSSSERPDYLLHIDYDEIEKDMPVVGSFTWPAFNCNSNTITVWYECLEDGKRIYKHGKQDVVITDQNLVLNEIDCHTFDTESFNAIILKHNDWHTVYNSDTSGDQRELLQWRFKPHLTWEEIKEINQKLIM